MGPEGIKIFWTTEVANFCDNRPGQITMFVTVGSLFSACYAFLRALVPSTNLNHTVKKRDLTVHNKVVLR